MILSNKEIVPNFKHAGEIFMPEQTTQSSDHVKQIEKRIVALINNENDRRSSSWSEEFLVPNDAIALARWINIDKFANVVASASVQSGKSVSEIATVVRERKLIPFIEEVIDFVIKNYR